MRIPDKARAARRMYDQRELTVQQIADVLGIGRSSVYRALGREGAVHGSTSRPTPDGPAGGGPGGLMSAPRPDLRTPPGGACPGCGQRPNSVETAARLRAELAVRWLVHEAGGLVARGFCHGCVPSGPVSEVMCGYCGDGPLLAGLLAGADPVADPAVAAWLVAEGWALHPAVTCPVCTAHAAVRTAP